MTRWLDPQPVEVPASFADLGLHTLAAQTLVRRGVTDPSRARAFLYPRDVPFTEFPGIEAAADLVRAAIQSSQEICVWGDFDVDGQTSTALLVQALHMLGAKTSYYIPVRAKESHGVHVESLKPIIQRGTGLLLTCDTGITAYEAVDYARASGLKVVITDHHDLGDRLPGADAIVNPKLLGAGHPLASLAGVGVAYKLAEALLMERHAAELPGLLDLVALGLIADVALLRDETRLLAQLGIRELQNTTRLGLKAIADLAGIDLHTLTEESIGFSFAPRLNALGRLADANPGVELLLTQDPQRARVLAAQIEGLNAQRRLLTSQVYQAAEAQLRSDPGLLTASALVLSNQNWPGGVVGIVASRLVERYHKPAILLSQSEDGMLRGSARSVEGLHITEAIAAQSAMLHGFGGHPMAAGLSLPADRLPAFRKGLNREVQRQLGSSAQEPPTLQLDGWLKLEEITPKLAEALECLAPFGAGNPGLVFATRDVTLRNISAVDRNGEHLRLSIAGQDGQVRQIIWWGADQEALPEPGSKIDIAYSLRLSSYRGQRQLSVQFVDFRSIEQGQDAEVAAPQIEVIDLRGEAEPVRKLDEIRQACPGIEILAEGMDRSIGKRRDQLQRAAELLIYSSPPSALELRKVMEKVQPQKVYLFSVSSAAESAEEFLNQLAGFCRYAINQRNGKASLEELCAATGQRISTVLHGLEWLRAGGHIAFEGNELLEISKGSSPPNTDLQKSFELTVRSLLQETAAYRRYYATVPDPLNLSTPGTQRD